MSDRLTLPPGAQAPGPLCSGAVSTARCVSPHPYIPAPGTLLSLDQPHLPEKVSGLQGPLKGPRDAEGL